jgi:PAP2 superfamily protein
MAYTRHSHSPWLASIYRGLFHSVVPDERGWQRASHREILILALYFSAIIVICDLLNIRLGAEYLTLTVSFAGVVISRAGRQFFRDWWLYLLGLFMWRLSSSVAAASPFPVRLNELIEVDRVLGLGHEPVVLVHQAFINSTRLEPFDWIAGIAYNLHLPETYITAYFLWRLSRPVYWQFASAVLILLVLGFITFIVFPTMPPWMASSWYHRVPGIVNRFGLVMRAHPRPLIGEPIFYIWKLRGDAVAAVPSEHAAFPMLEFLALREIFPRGAFLLVPWVLFVFFVVVYLGMHWTVDVLLGWMYALVIFVFVRWYARR